MTNTSEEYGRTQQGNLLGQTSSACQLITFDHHHLYDLNLSDHLDHLGYDNHIVIISVAINITIAIVSTGGCNQFVN